MNGPDRSPGPRDWLPLLCVVWLVSFTLYFFSLHLPNSSRNLSRLDIWALLPELIHGDLFPVSSPEYPSGWSYLGQRIPVALPAILVLAGAAALGRLMLRGLRVCSQFDPPARAAISVGIGLSLWSLLTLLLGLAGMLHRMLFVLLLFGFIVVETFWTFSDLRQQSAGARAARYGHSKTAIACVALMVLFVGPMVLGALLPETDFDVKEYHLQGPKEYLQQGRITFLPHNVYTSFPFLTEMLSLSGMVVHGDWEMGALSGKLVLMAFAPLTALGAFALARRLAGERAAWFAALMYLSTPWAYRISIIAYTEGAMCAFVMLTLLALWFLAASDSEVAHSSANDQYARFGVEALVGILAGSAAATKYPGLVFVTIPAFMVVVLVVVLRRFVLPSGANLTPRAGLFGSALICGLGVLLTFGPWLAKNFVETGNPVYPLAYSVFGGSDWDEQMDAKWKRAHGPPPGRFTNPRMLTTRLIDVAAQSDWQSPLLFGLAPCAWLGMTRRRWLWGLAGYVGFVFAGWYVMTHHIDRFWLPLLPPLAVLAGIGGDALLSRLNRLMHSNNSVLRFSGGIGSLIAPGVALGVLLFNAVFITTPECGPNAYLLDYRTALRETTTRSIALAEELLPDDATVLFVGEAEVFNAHFKLHYNTVFDRNLLEDWCVDAGGKSVNVPYPLRSTEKIRSSLQAAGITHVLVNWKEVLRYRAPSSYGFTDFVSPARFHQLVDLSLLSPVEIPVEQRYRLWEDIDPEQQQELTRWSPELKENVNGYEAIRMYDLYAVTPPPLN